jgi:hypothetical protein
MSLRNLVAEHGESRGDALLVFFGDNQGPKPKKASVLLPVTYVSGPNLPGEDRFPKIFPILLRVHAGTENSRAGSYQFFSGISRNPQHFVVDAPDNSMDIDLKLSFVDRNCRNLIFQIGNPLLKHERFVFEKPVFFV